jgi:hypothetical protein
MVTEAIRFSDRGERRLVLLLCLLATLHGFIFSAAFPFFNNVDEREHFDLVLKYAHGEIPRKLDLLSGEALNLIALYNAPGYGEAKTNTAAEPPPPGTLPTDEQAAWLAANLPGYAGTNYESSQPPAYYAVAGAWWNLGGRLGLGGVGRLYWLRFLNLPVVGLLVWLSWLAALTVSPDKNFFLRLGVPAFLAFMPQSVFYSVDNDVFSPLCFGLAFVCLLRFWAAENPPVWLGAVSGLALAAAFLTKMTNLPPLLVTAAALVLFISHRWRAAKLAPTLPALTAMALCALPPVVAWLAWCQKNFDDLTGSSIKARFWGWTLKPFPEWFHHPIFTPAGARKFSAFFITEFWQGEMSWHGQPLSFRAASWAYVLVTLSLLVAAVAVILRRSAGPPWPVRRALWFSLFTFASCAGFLVYVSIRFDFHECHYPSRAIPYLFSGRLALGALIPFMLLLVSGLDRVLERFSVRAKFLVLGALILAMLANEIATDWPVFASKYNWFHL